MKNSNTAYLTTNAKGYTFINFYNSKEVYSQKMFTTIRKARNYAKKYGTELTAIPENIDFETIIIER